MQVFVLLTVTYSAKETQIYVRFSYRQTTGHYPVVQATSWVVSSIKAGTLNVLSQTYLFYISYSGLNKSKQDTCILSLWIPAPQVPQ